MQNTPCPSYHAWNISMPGCLPQIQAFGTWRPMGSSHLSRHLSLLTGYACRLPHQLPGHPTQAPPACLAFFLLPAPPLPACVWF